MARSGRGTARRASSAALSASEEALTTFWEERIQVSSETGALSGASGSVMTDSSALSMPVPVARVQRASSAAASAASSAMSASVRAESASSRLALFASPLSTSRRALSSAKSFAESSALR
ncbi:MAG TPA: hypothetical protein DIC34_16455 [Treponema sp.]|nr:hypothetical protein [Treponema sp.]